MCHRLVWHTGVSPSQVSPPPPPPLARQLARRCSLPTLRSSGGKHLKHLNGAEECVFSPAAWSHVHWEALSGCTRRSEAEGTEEGYSLSVGDGARKGRRGHQVTVNSVRRATGRGGDGGNVGGGGGGQRGDVLGGGSPAVAPRRHPNRQVICEIKHHGTWFPVPVPRCSLTDILRLADEMFAPLAAPRNPNLALVSPRRKALNCLRRLNKFTVPMTNFEKSSLLRTHPP